MSSWLLPPAHYRALIIRNAVRRSVVRRRREAVEHSARPARQREALRLRHRRAARRQHRAHSRRRLPAVYGGTSCTAPDRTRRDETRTFSRLSASAASFLFSSLLFSSPPLIHFPAFLCLLFCFRWIRGKHNCVWAPRQFRFSECPLLQLIYPMSHTTT